jgi:D-alanine-D-alanine ligase
VIKIQTDTEFYDYNAKYISRKTHYICPCGLENLAEKNLQNIALKAFKLLGCSGWGRVDFIINSTGEMFLLEINTVPGMTTHSLVPMSAKAAGISFNQLITQIIHAK